MEILIRLTVASLWAGLDAASHLIWVLVQVVTRYLTRMLPSSSQSHGVGAYYLSYHISAADCSDHETVSPRCLTLHYAPPWSRIMTEGGWRENRMSLCCVTVFTFQWLLLIFSEHIWTERSVAPISAKVELNRGVSAVGASTKINKLAKLGGKHVDVDIDLEAMHRDQRGQNRQWMELTTGAGWVLAPIKPSALNCEPSGFPFPPRQHCTVLILLLVPGSGPE